MKMNFYMPTKVIMSKECVKSNSASIAALGKKALIVTGRSSAKANGSLQDILDALKTEKIEYVIYDKVMSNPTIDCAYDGAAVAKENQVDFIIAIGGGSPMDAAKAMALLARQDIKRENLFSGLYKDDVLPLCLIPTTAGTGSEVTTFSVLTNDELETKSSITSPFLFPDLALLDAKYTGDLPLDITINTALDALSHSIEGMMSAKATVITDALAIESIEKISACFDALCSNQICDTIREDLLYGSMLGGIVIAHTGTTAVHAMGYSLTYFKNIDHGRANGLLLPEFMKFVQISNPELIRKILTAMKFKNLTEFGDVIDKLLGEKESLSLEELDKFSGLAIKTKNIPNCIAVPTLEILETVYKKSFLLH